MTINPPTATAKPLPLLGHGLQLVRDPLGFFEGMVSQGPVVRFKVGTRPGFALNDADLAREVLITDRTSYDKGGPFIEAVRMVTGNGLGASNAADHDRQRPLLQPAFQHSRLPTYVGVMQACAAEAVDRWTDGGSIDVYADAYRLFSDITTRTLVSTSTGVEATRVMGETMPVLLDGAFRRAMVPVEWFHRLPLPANRTYQQAHSDLTAAMDEIVTQYRAEDYDHGDVLSMIMASRDQDTDQGLTDSEVQDQIRTVLLGSIETETSLLAWVLHHVVRHPEVEQRMWDELNTVLKGSAAPDFEQLMQLTYTKQIVTEAHRLSPPVWMFTRLALRDTELGGVAIPRGSDIYICPYTLHRDPTRFPDPERFDPDRWAPGNVSSAQRQGFLGFGAGRTKCLGDVFGPTAVTVALAAIGTRWRLREDPAFTTRTVTKVTLSPGHQHMTTHLRRPAAPATESERDEVPAGL